MKLIFLGAPGAGKGTQAEKVSEKLGIPTISTGNIIREALKNKTEMGLKAQSFIEAGKLDTTPLITHRYPLSDIEEAYRIFENKLDGVIKVAITP